MDTKSQTTGDVKTLKEYNNAVSQEHLNNDLYKEMVKYINKEYIDELKEKSNDDDFLTVKEIVSTPKIYNAQQYTDLEKILLENTEKEQINYLLYAFNGLDITRLISLVERFTHMPRRNDNNTPDIQYVQYNKFDCYIHHKVTDPLLKLTKQVNVPIFMVVLVCNASTKTTLLDSILQDTLKFNKQ